jgi:hypothetical protein
MDILIYKMEFIFFEINNRFFIKVLEKHPIIFNFQLVID